MKKIKYCFLLGIIMAFFTSLNVKAELGDFGFFGGISDGRDLPKTTELLLDDDKNEELESIYKEVNFLSGRPITLEGNITVDMDEPDEDETMGSYEADYEYNAVYTPEQTDNEDEEGAEGEDEGASLTRSITYEVKYRKEGSQTIKDFGLEDPDDWTETITANGQTYSLDQDRSKSSISVIEDKTPGVTYYKGNLNHRAVYTSDNGDVILDMNGTFYGYNCAYSSTETHRIDCTVTTNDWQMQYQLRPSVSMGKTLQYTSNEPTAISFDGNYQEIMQNRSGLSYNIYVLPVQLTYEVEPTGNVSIDTFNNFEQLIAPDVSYLKGHFAEDDIKRLFSMKILDGITRGQFVEMLVKAIKLPIEDTSSNRSSRRRQTVVNLVFPDVLPERADYPYVMAAYKAGLAVGRDNGHFYIDSPIERQEAIVILLRTLGLENLGLDPTPITSFTDDKNIASWAKKEIYAANRIGIIAGDDDGRFKPTDYVSKAEAAAFVNRLNNYMRNDLQTDYTEHIVNYAN